MKPDPIALIIDDDRAVRRLVRAVLSPNGYRLFEAANGEEGLKVAVECKPDVIILEPSLPDDNGLKVIQALREWSQTPVLALSYEAEDKAKVAAFDAGVSDYLTKPFSSAELLARLRVLQRPLPNVPDGPLLIEGDLVVNLAIHRITLKGRVVPLTHKEEALFYVLARYAGKVVTCAHLLRAVWGVHSKDRLHDLRVLVGHLRKKLGAYSGDMLIKTEGSTGYCLVLCLQPRFALDETPPREGQTEVASA